MLMTFHTPLNHCALLYSNSIVMFPQKKENPRVETLQNYCLPSLSSSCSAVIVTRAELVLDVARCKRQSRKMANTKTGGFL